MHRLTPPHSSIFVSTTPPFLIIILNVVESPFLVYLPSSNPRRRSRTLFMNGQTLEIGSPSLRQTTNALFVARSPRYLLHPRIRARAASIEEKPKKAKKAPAKKKADESDGEAAEKPKKAKAVAARSWKSLSSVPQLPSTSRTLPSPKPAAKRTRVLADGGAIAVYSDPGGEDDREEHGTLPSTILM
ncbi:hypothetical protein BYT27DRAFT_7254138 [Phlegmacium glaucopus]|nr:hypothetical protein BYT27DRAFT_7254138 [Phlegmacium glaucopus]